MPLGPRVLASFKGTSEIETTTILHRAQYNKYDIAVKWQECEDKDLVIQSIRDQNPKNAATLATCFYFSHFEIGSQK